MTRGQAEAIAAARKVTNPGCHATGAIALLRPLTDAGLLPKDAAVSIGSISGYSGGGKSMIEAYESGRAPAFEHYGLGLEHKHMPEIADIFGPGRRARCSCPRSPIFGRGCWSACRSHLDTLPGEPDGRAISGPRSKAHYRGAATSK